MAMAAILGNDNVSNYFRQRLGDIQANPDPFAASEDLRRLNRYSDYLRSLDLPPGVGTYVQNQIIAHPDTRLDYSNAAQSALYDLGQLAPGASDQRVDQLSQQVLPAYLRQQASAGSMGQLQELLTGAPPQKQQPTPRQQPTPGPAVGFGTVNGQGALYPTAGHMGEYQATMQQLGLNPGKRATMASSCLLSRALRRMLPLNVVD